MATRRIKVRAQELRDADVQFLSIVQRGANRAPFKIQKSDEGGTAVLNFRALFKTGDPIPNVVAVAVATGTDIEQAKVRLKKAGFSVDSPQEAHGATLFIQKDCPLGEAGQVTLKIDDSTAIVVSEIPREIPDWAGTDAYYPGIDLSVGILKERLLTAFKAEKSELALDTARKAVVDFNAYIDALFSTIPVQALKLEIESLPVVAKAETQEEWAAQDETEEEPTDGDDFPDGADEEEEQGEEGEEVSALSQQIKSLHASIQTSLGGLGGQIEQMRSRLDQVETIARKAGEAVHGTVLGTPDTDRSGGGTRDYNTDPPLIDTGLVSLYD